VPSAAGEVELHEQVVVVVVAAAVLVFPAPGVQPVVPQMADRAAVRLLVGVGEGPVVGAGGRVHQLHGDDVTGIDLQDAGLTIVAVARAVGGPAA
jgi:hypothetical protein